MYLLRSIKKSHRALVCAVSIVMGNASAAGITSAHGYGFSLTNITSTFQQRPYLYLPLCVALTYLGNEYAEYKALHSIHYSHFPQGDALLEALRNAGMDDVDDYHFTLLKRTFSLQEQLNDRRLSEDLTDQELQARIQANRFFIHYFAPVVGIDLNAWSYFENYIFVGSYNYAKYMVHRPLVHQDLVAMENNAVTEKLDALSIDDELLAVLFHEREHTIQNHVPKRVAAQLLVSVGLPLCLGIGLDNYCASYYGQDYEEVAGWCRNLITWGLIACLTPLSMIRNVYFRSHERQADKALRDNPRLARAMVRWLQGFQERKAYEYSCVADRYNQLKNDLTELSSRTFQNQELFVVKKVILSWWYLFHASLHDAHETTTREAIEKLSHPTLIGQLLSTHPSDEERIAYLTQWAQEAEEIEDIEQKDVAEEQLSVVG